MLDFLGDWEEGWMTVYLASCRLEQRFLVAGAAGHLVGGLDHPDAQAFVAARVNVARVIDRHFGVGCMQAAHMFVGQAVLAANEDLPERPPVLAHFPIPRCRLLYRHSIKDKSTRGP